MVTKPFNAKKVRAFLDCVSASPETYKVKVEDHGTILVKPSSPRSLDRNGKDKTLFDCIEKYVGMLGTAAQSSLFSQEGAALLKSLSDVTAEDLSDMCASGQALVSIAGEHAVKETMRTVFSLHHIQFASRVLRRQD